MEVQQDSSPPPPTQFRFVEMNPEMNGSQSGSSDLEKHTIIVTNQVDTLHPTNSNVVVTSANNNYTLTSAKPMDLIEDEFVSKLKAEPGQQNEEGRQGVVMSVSGDNCDTTTVMAGGEQSHLVYCNLSDLDLSGSTETYSLSSLHSLAEASSSVQQQERNPYSAVSTILLHGGILQLKQSEPNGGGSLVSGLGGQDQVLMTVGGGSHDKMAPSPQVVSVSGRSNHTSAQDAIASILASMNNQNMEANNSNPVDYSSGVQEVDEVVSLDHHNFENDRQEVLPLNLATSSPSQFGSMRSGNYHQTFYLVDADTKENNFQTSQEVQIQNFKRIGQQTIMSSSLGGMVTKKVIIATINGTQRILTPVSSPQIIAMKTSPRILSDGTMLNGSSPIIIQKPLSSLNKPKQLNSPVLSSRSTDNKTCLWKFENGQICGKVFTKTYNLTVHMRMHQDIRPFPCTICEQTFRQKAHLQRHEATHGIDSTANRKRRKRPLMDDLQELSKQTGTESDEEMYRPFVEKRKFSLIRLKSEEDEDDMDVDPMIEPIDGSQLEKKLVCPVNVGTNTEVTRHDVADEIEESSLEPVRFRSCQPSRGVEQGVQYSEEDLIIPESTYQDYEGEDGRIESIESKDIVRYVQPSKSVLKTEEEGEEEVGEDQVYSSQHYVTTINGHEISDGHHMIAQTADGQFIDTSTNQIVMSHDGELVGFVPVDGEQSQVVNISTTTNEHGQQVVIIENLHHHSPELQREIMNALISENNLVPLTQS